MTRIRMPTLVLGAVLASLLAGCGGQGAQVPGTAANEIRLPDDVRVFRLDRQLHYQGEITTDGVAAVRALTAGRPIDELHISSQGGEINAGMDLGDWVHQLGWSVVVEEYCLSSCANYVFTAGWQKILAGGAVVAWHGSARQHDLPAQLVRVVDDQIKALPLSAVARSQERERRQRAVADYLKHAIARQDAFFQRVGVSEYVTRVGHERHGVDGLYSLSVADMRRFGIDNVVLTQGGSEEDAIAIQQKLNVRIVRLQLDESVVYQPLR